MLLLPTKKNLAGVSSPWHSFAPPPALTSCIYIPKELLPGNLTQKDISKCDFFIDEETHGDHLRILSDERIPEVFKVLD